MEKKWTYKDGLKKKYRLVLYALKFQRYISLLWDLRNEFWKGFVLIPACRHRISCNPKLPRKAECLAIISECLRKLESFVITRLIRNLAPDSIKWMNFLQVLSPEQNITSDFSNNAQWSLWISQSSYRAKATCLQIQLSSSKTTQRKKKCFFHCHKWYFFYHK